MPDDVKTVHDENDEARVPARRSTVLELVFLLNVDILAPHHRFKCGRQRRCKRRVVLARAARHRPDIQKKKEMGLRPSMASNVFRRLRPPVVGALYVHLLSPCVVRSLTNHIFPLGCECVLRLPPVSQLCGVNPASGSFSSLSTDPHNLMESDR